MKALASSSIAAFGYVYHFSSNAQMVPVGSNIRYNHNGPLKGIGHILGSSKIKVASSGIYYITFAVYTSVNNPEIWGVAINGVVRSLFSADGKSLNASTALRLKAGDVITIRNVATEPDPAVLRTGSRTAWVQITRVSS